VKQVLLIILIALFVILALITVILVAWPFIAYLVSEPSA